MTLYEAVGDTWAASKDEDLRAGAQTREEDDIEQARN